METKEVPDIFIYVTLVVSFSQQLRYGKDWAYAYFGHVFTAEYS